MVIGEISFSMAMIDNACNVLILLQGVIKDAKAFGSDVRSLYNQIAFETARLEAFSAFLKHKTPSGETQFDQLPVLTKQAILGNLQELGILFGHYTAMVAKYGVEKLQHTYELILDADTDDIFSDALVEEGVTKSKATQKEAKITEVLAWGLFRKKRVVELADKLALWNDKLMKLLLCGLCFGKFSVSSPCDDAVAQENLTKLQVSTGLSLRKIILESSNSNDTNILKHDLKFLEPNSSSKIKKVAVPATNGNCTQEDLVYVEYKPYKLPARRSNDKNTVQRACNLARLLCHPNASNAGFQTLHLRCLVQEKRPSTRFAFVFDIPAGVDPRPVTLLQAIKNQSGDPLARPTLGQRFRMARSLAETLFQFHSIGWLHKSIRSENILLFPYPSNPSSNHLNQNKLVEYTRPYLVGFEFSRDALDRSNIEQDGLLEHNIYRHPDRQGSPSDERDSDGPFTLLHDIYALGVVLLEVGLWRAVVEYEDWEGRSADDIQQSLEEHAEQRLPHYMGQAYTDLIVACLQGSFMHGERGGGALSDVERERIQLAYYEAVIAGIGGGLSLK